MELLTSSMLICQVIFGSTLFTLLETPFLRLASPHAALPELPCAG